MSYETDLEFSRDITAHLADIALDTSRVCGAFVEELAAVKNGDHAPRIDAEELKSKLSDISNQLDDLYRQLKAIPDDQPSL